MEVKIINNRPVKIWTSNVEESAMRQIENLTTLPFLYHHLAIMPDVHAGMGMPIGGVLACDGAVIPNAVGVDIGCECVPLKQIVVPLPEGCSAYSRYTRPLAEHLYRELFMSVRQRCGQRLNIKELIMDVYN